MLLALDLVEREFAKFGLDTVVTSANDATHSAHSLHYSGRALDFRTKHAAGVMKGIYQATLKTLFPLGFDVIWEDQGKDNEHLHVEYDPK